MGKKKLRKATSSKGIHSATTNGVLKALRATRSVVEKMQFKTDAWKAGKNPWITVPTNQKNKPFIRVRANEYYGDFRNQPKEQNNNDANSVQ